MFLNLLFVLTHSWLIHLTESIALDDLLKLSKTIDEIWHFKGITFVDASDESLFDSDYTSVEIHNFIKLHAENVMTFQTSKTLAINPDYLKNGAVVVNSENPLLLEQIGVGLHKTLTWFAPAGTNLSGIKLRLDSSLYLFEIVNTTILLYEVFAIKNGPQIRNPVGTWTKERGLILKSPEMWDNRRSLSNVTLVNTLLKIKLPPVLSITEANGRIKTTGYMSELQDELSSILGLNVKTIITPDGLFGSNMPNGSWNGMIGMLDRKDADISIMGLGMSLDRVSVTDFTIPVIRQPTTLLIKKVPDRVLNVSAYLQTFTTGTWIVIGLTAVTMVVCLVAIGNLEQNKFGFLYYVDVVFKSLLQKDPRYNGIRHSTKAIVFMVGMTFYMIFVYFSTVITSYMTALGPPILIKSFADVLKYDYRMVTMNDSVYEFFLASSKPQSTLYDIYHHHMKHQPGAFLPFDKVLEVVRHNPKTVIFATPITFYGQDGITALALSDSISTYRVIYLQKDSEFTGLYNYYILKLMQSGIMSKIQSKWFIQGTQKNDKNGLANEAIVLNYGNLIFPCLMFLSGVVLAGLGLALEIMWKKGSLHLAGQGCGSHT